MIKSNNLKQG